MSVANDGPEFEAHSPVFGDPLRLIDLNAGVSPHGPEAPGCIRLGIDRAGLRPPIQSADFDLLLTTAANAARPWVYVPAAELEERIGAVQQAVHSCPVTASILSQTLRVGEKLEPVAALTLESLAYSTLLAGDEFRAWRKMRPARTTTRTATARVQQHRRGDVLIIELIDVEHRNAFDARMRDELVETLQVAMDDLTLCALELRAQGPHFSAGGDLNEFGSASDLAMAHAVRMLRSPVRLLLQMKVPSSAFVHGGCIGAGIEVPAAASRVIAAPDAWFWLPEVSMGLIPAAGGTVSIARRIGRHRLLYLALANLRLDVNTALDWGLIDGMESVA
jgi:hypothetical protein